MRHLLTADARATDYNRHGRIALMVDDIDVDLWKRLADERTRLRVTVEVVGEDEGECE